MGFRNDINGLRAWAVVLVVLYHFSVPGFSGGFVGVDVFFVISGFLMTGIILGAQSRGDFSLSRFYLARARRIVPALAVLCLAMLVFGWFWLAALDYKLLGKHVLSAIAFVSNLVFSSEAGYFDADAHEKWLLHTWSLSVEWQFYLLYPLLLMALKRYLPSAVTLGIWLLFGLSLSASVGMALSRPEVGFFLLTTRAWEMLAGALVYVHGERVLSLGAPRRLMEATGIVLILLAGTWLADPAQWPGYQALLPVAGAVLVLLAQRSDSGWTGNVPAQALGRWSYSIYLWHWPLLVGANYFGLLEGVPVVFGLIGLSVLMGYLSFRFVEEPIRHSALGRRVHWRAMGGAMLSVGLIGGALSKAEGLPSRLPDSLAQVEAEAINKKRIMKTRCGWDPDGVGFPECRYGDEAAAPRVAMWGDSHALAATRAVDAAAKKVALSVVLYNENSCPPVQNVTRNNPNRSEDCIEFNREVRDRLLANDGIDTVLFMARWSVYLEGSNESDKHPFVSFPGVETAGQEDRRREYAQRLLQTWCEVAQHKQVVVVAPLPEFGVHLPRLVARSIIAKGEVVVPRLPMEEYRDRNRVVLETLRQAGQECGIQVIDPVPLLCDDSYCYGADRGLPIYFDDDHLGSHGNRMVEPLFEALFRDITRQEAAR